MYNIKDMLIEEKSNSLYKPSITNFSFSIGLDIFTQKMSNYSTTYLRLMVNKLNENLYQTREVLSGVSNNTKLKAVKDIIDTCIVKEVSITGYNYTNLHTHINIKNSYIKHYEFFKEVYDKIIEIVSSDDSEDTKLSRLDNVYDLVDKFLEKYNSKFPLNDYGFSYKTTFPDYYNGGTVNVDLFFNGKTDFLKVYNRIKLCDDQYNALLKSYERDLNKYYMLIDKVLVASHYDNDTFMGIMDDYNPIKNKINAIANTEMKIAKNMLSKTSELLSFQINAILDSLKQDMSVLQEIADAYKNSDEK